METNRDRNQIVLRKKNVISIFYNYASKLEGFNTEKSVWIPNIIFIIIFPITVVS